MVHSVVETVEDQAIDSGENVKGGGHKLNIYEPSKRALSDKPYSM